MNAGMRSNTFSREYTTASDDMHVKGKSFTRMTCVAGAAIGSFGGLMSLFLGLLCSVGDEFLGSNTLLSKMATVLMIAGIPMMLAGSALMDKVERLDRPKQD